MQEQREHLQMWTVYFNPTDYPGKYVARLFHNDTPQDCILVSGDIDIVREFLLAIQLYPLARQPGDEPHIVETWV